MLQRRDFITGCAASAAALAAPGGVLAAASAVEGQPSPQGATTFIAGRAKVVFSKALGQQFRCIDSAGLTRTLVLSEVIDGPDMPGIEQFMVAFADKSEGVLARMDAGTFLLHLESAGARENRYVVHFSLLT